MEGSSVVDVKLFGPVQSVVSPVRSRFSWISSPKQYAPVFDAVGTGSGLMVTVVVTTQPFASVYSISTVPALTPVTVTIFEPTFVSVAAVSYTHLTLPTIYSV